MKADARESSPVLEAYDLEVTYAQTSVLWIPHLTLHEGERLVLIGPNGAGKTTLLRVLATLQKPSRGRIVYRGHVLDRRRARVYRRRVAVVLHPPPLLDLSVYHNVALGLYLRGMRGATVRARVMEWLQRFHVHHLAQRRALGLSRGELQRVALARAFVLEPDILFLDEPFSGLDEPTRERLLPDVRRNLEATGITTFLITHNREDALALGDRVAVMLAGRICQIGTPQEVFTAPVSVDVARFVGADNILPAEVVRATSLTRVRCLPEGPELLSTRRAPKQEVLVCVRPEHVRLADESMSAQAPGVDFEARVEEVVPLGTRVRVRLRCGGVTLSALWDYVYWQTRPARVGARVILHVAADHVHLLPSP